MKMNADNKRGNDIRYLPLCLLVTRSIILDMIKMTAHQKIAHMLSLGTIQSPRCSGRVASLLVRITDLPHPLWRSLESGPLT